MRRLQQNHRSLLVLAALVFALAAPAARATDYLENEPNNDFPPTFLPGNPTFLSGDRLLGSITSGDIDSHYITFAGPEAPGLYRYTFDLLTSSSGSNGRDSLLDIYDASENGFYLVRSDDFPGQEPASRIIFDQFHSSTANTVFGVDVFGFASTDIFDYQLTISRIAPP
jgi:hypothetical protein